MPTPIMIGKVGTMQSTKVDKTLERPSFIFERNAFIQIYSIMAKEKIFFFRDLLGWNRCSRNNPGGKGQDPC